jgi:hypothetical protein
MTRKQVMISAGFLLALTGGAATAGPDQVAYPLYQTHVLYDVLDKTEDKEIMEFYINPEAFKSIRHGQPRSLKRDVTRTVLRQPKESTRIDYLDTATCQLHPLTLFPGS